MTKQEFIKIFREAEWLTPERIQLWATCFAMTWFLFLAWDAWAHSAMGITDAAGEHIGRDFINYWGGALLAVHGKAAIAYDVKDYLAYQKTLAGPASEFKTYSYPPVAMLLTLPLALMSFGVGYVFWTFASYATTVKMMTRYVSLRMAAVAALAAPVCMVNIQSGQNGAFTAALLSTGLLLLQRRPVLAGICLGLLCYKPQIGLLLPLALAAGGYWRSFFAASVTVIVLVVVSGFAFGNGLDIWLLFGEQMKHQTVLLEDWYTLWHRMPTVFAGARVPGIPQPLAYAAQVVSALAVLCVVAKTWRGPAPLPLKAATYALSIFLFSPYAWDYDMVITVFALLWVIDDAKKTGWQPWEKFAWLLLILLPLHMTPLSKLVHIQTGAALIWWVMWLVQKRIALPRPA